MNDTARVEQQAVTPSRKIGVGESFFLNNLGMDRVFNTIERADYLILYYVRREADEEGRAYLASLASALNWPMPEVSRAVEKLQDKGYVSWKTDPAAGKTYVTLTSRATERMEAQRQYMKTCYQRLQKEIGAEELERTAATMRQVGEILRSSADQQRLGG